MIGLDEDKSIPHPSFHENLPVHQPNEDLLDKSDKVQVQKCIAETHSID